MSTPRENVHIDAEFHVEPDITQEESVPSDGRDHEGEELMKQVTNPTSSRGRQATAMAIITRWR